MRIEWRRTIEEIQEKTPKPKTTMRPNFSEFGRCMRRRVGMGRAMIHMSVKILMALVAMMY